MLGVKEVLGLAVVSVADDIIDRPHAVLAGGDSDAVAHHAGVVAIHDPFVAVQGVAEDPDRTPVRQGNGIGRVGTPPRLLEREAGRAIAGRLFLGMQQGSAGKSNDDGDDDLCRATTSLAAQWHD